MAPYVGDAGAWYAPAADQAGAAAGRTGAGEWGSRRAWWDGENDLGSSRVHPALAQLPSWLPATVAHRLLTAPHCHVHDLRAVEHWQLQEFCRRQGLYARGSKQELKLRIIGAMAIGTRVAVKNALFGDLKTGSITALRRQPRW